MKIYRIAIVFLSFMTLFLTQCSNDEGICIGTTGRTVTQEREAPAYHYVEVYDNINLFLTQDSTVNSIRVEAGENLVSGITTQIDSGRLVLRNQNTCNWMRRFDVPVNVYLTFTGLDTLVFHAAGNITCTNAWTNDSVRFEVIEGAGQIDLNLNVFKSYLTIRYGTVSVSASGFSQVTFISSQGYGPLHAEDLNSKFTYVYTFSPNDLFVRATVQLGVEIGNIGNVYYRGDPADIYTIITGKGRLIEF
jgi:hypothetical protein